MSSESLSRRTVLFVNAAHALDHFLLLIYPTAVIAIAAETGMAYASLIALATGAFVAFGLFSLPMGWLADRFGRCNLLAVFFAGCGLSCLGLASASGPMAFAGWLFVLGVFTAIYHPVGSAMLVTHATRLGRDLGWNGVWGNLGAASAPAITALLAVSLGWRAAFVIPGFVCLAVGAAFLGMVSGESDGQGREGSRGTTAALARPILLLGIFAVAIIAGGMTFNITTIALPKIIDEQLGLDLPMVVTGSLATGVFLFGALTQLLMGHLIDRYTLPIIFVGLSLLQPLGLGLAALSTGMPLLVGLVLAIAAIYGQVIINDAMVARYVPPQYRTKAYSVRYFLGFTVSGLAAPAIAVLHGDGGFALVLGAAGAFGLLIFLAACMFALMARPRPLVAKQVS
jgi:MFS family permease